MTTSPRNNDYVMTVTFTKANLPEAELIKDEANTGKFVNVKFNYLSVSKKYVHVLLIGSEEVLQKLKKDDPRMKDSTVSPLYHAAAEMKR